MKKAVIFDLDGTMIDNHYYHKKAWVEFCKKRGFDFDDEEFRTKIFGKTTREFVRILFGDITSEEARKYEEEKEELYRYLYKEEITPIFGLVEFLESLREDGFLLGVATSAPWANLEFSLKGLGLEKMFDSLKCLDDIRNEKPDPEIYIGSMRELDVHNARTIVFEDSTPGVKAGLNSGAKVVGVTTSLSATDLGNVSMAIANYSQITVDQINALIS